jgi:OmpA-OmpF porin, OOP family
MPLRPPAFAACFALCTAMGSSVHAQATSDSPHRFQLNPIQPASPQSPLFTVEGPSRPRFNGWGVLSASLLVDYARSPLTAYVRRNGSTEFIGAPVRHQLLSRISVGLQISQRWSVDLLAPFSLYQQGDSVVSGSAAVPAPSRGTALGDMRFGALFRGWANSTFGYALGVRGWAPTGSQDAYMSDGRFRIELLAGAFAQTGRLSSACTLFGSPTFVSPHQGDRLALGCAADVLTARALPSLGIEAVASAIRYDPASSPGSNVELWAAVRERVGDVTFALAAGPGMGSSPGTATWRALALIAYAPQHGGATAESTAPLDQDYDGIADSSDACPSEAGLPSADRSRHGCPNMDSDGDGIVDRMDGCPYKAGVFSSDKTVNGCPDSDNDHVVDKLDRCPHEPAEPSDDPDTLGCPRRARLRGDRFVIHPPLSITGDSASQTQDDEALREVAFGIRANRSIAKVALGVTLQGVDTDTALVNRALSRATELARRLVELGLARDKIDPVGGVSPAPAHIDIVVTERTDRVKP